MRIKLVHGLVASTLLAMGSFGAAADPAPVADDAVIVAAILAVHDQTIAAAEARDLDRLFSFVLENDAGALVSNGVVQLTRADALATTRAGFQGIASVKYNFTARRVTVLSPTSAVLVSSGSVAATTDDSRSFTNGFTQSVLFVLRDGHWRIVHTHQSSPVPR